MNEIDDVVSKLIEEQNKKIDQLIEHALPAGITLKEAVGRCRWIYKYESMSISSKTFEFDGKQIFTIHNPKYETIKKGKSIKLKITSEIEYH